MTLRRVFSLLLLLVSCSLLFSCGDGSVAETEHIHEYCLVDTVYGTCIEPGHQLFVCSCGEQFESAVPMPHTYASEPAKIGMNSYVKHFCEVCGAYALVHDRTFIYNVDFEGAEDAESAFIKGNSEIYRTSASKNAEDKNISLVDDMGDKSLMATDCNIYTVDKTRAVEEGKDFVVSFDVRFKEYGRTAIFSIICQNQGATDFSYNAGLVFIEEDGKLSTSAPGNSAVFKKATFSKEGYDTVTIKGNLKTGLYDVYFNGEQIRKDIPYVRMENPSLACLRFFDAQNSKSYTALIDNIEVYEASEPVFSSGEIAFEEGGHLHTVVEEVVEPTCSQDGSRVGVCTTCEQQVFAETINKIDHVVKGEISCTQNSVCADCGIVLRSATAHTVESYFETKPATKTETGYQKGNCSVCGMEVTKILPMGVVEGFENFPKGTISPARMESDSVFTADYDCSVKNGVYEVVSEGENNYLKKNAADGHILYSNGKIDADRIEIAFDLRVDQASTKNKGLVSLWGATEMRILSLTDSNKLGFGLGNGVFVFAPCKIGEWFSVRIIVHVKTFNYEIYIDGEKVLETESDPNQEGQHLLYVYENGEKVQKTEADGYDSADMHDRSKRNPFVLYGDYLTGFEFFHYSADLVGAMDNLAIGYVKD